MTYVNQDTPDVRSPYDPTGRVTGLFHDHDAVTIALAGLAETGVRAERVDLFGGRSGTRAVEPDPTGATRGQRLYRSLEQWVSDTSAFHTLAAATLSAGGYLVAVRVDDEPERKNVVMDVLTRSGAADVKFWTTYYVEQGHEDVPQSPAG